MDIIALFASAAGILVAVGTIGLHIEHKRDQAESLETFKAYDHELTLLRRRLTVLENIDRNASDKVYIVNVQDQDLNFPNSEAR